MFGLDLFSFLGKIFTGTLNNNLGDVLNELDEGTDLAGSIQSYFDKATGRRLTAAEREANSFNASEAQKQRDFEQSMFEQQTELSNTSYQRQVADMQAAGLNPMMAVSSGGGAVVPSAGSGSSASSVSPGSASFNLGSLLSGFSSLFMLPMQRKLMAAEIDKTNADAAKARADADSTNQQVDFFARIAGYREDGERLSNEMTRSQMKQIEQYINESKAKEKSALAQSILDKANADNVVYMRPFVSAELSAKTDLERKQARVAVLDAAYRQGLLDNHVIEQGIKESNARVAESGSKVTANEAMAELERVHALIAKGDKHALASELGLLDKIDFWAKDVIGALTDVVKSVPINFVVK